MTQGFRIRIGFVDVSPHDSNVLIIGGTVLAGDIHNGASGTVRIDTVEIPLTVISVAFLERASADSIMFSVNRPSATPPLHKWVGNTFIGCSGATLTGEG